MEISGCSFFPVSTNRSCGLYVASGALVTISLIGVGAILTLHAINPTLFFSHGGYYLFGGPALAAVGALILLCPRYCFPCNDPTSPYVFSEEVPKDDNSLDSSQSLMDSSESEKESTDYSTDSSSFSSSEEEIFHTTDIVIAKPIKKPTRIGNFFFPKIPEFPAENPEVDYSPEYLPTSSRYWDRGIQHAYPIVSPLSAYWQDDENLTFKKFMLLTAIYPLGSAGFIVALPYRFIRIALRIGILVKSLIFASFGSASADEIKHDATMVGIAGLKFLSGFLGVLCPPGTYWVERKIDDLTPEKDTTFFYVGRINVDIPAALAILEFSENETPTKSEIKARYRTMILEKHPDKNKREDASTEFAQIQAAYEILDRYYNEA